MSGEPDVGFAVAGGESARLYDAARWHEGAADDLDGHAALIDHTAGSLTTAWQGDAASSYQALSRAVVAHFRAAADSSRTASMILRRYAHELDEYQREGRYCQAEAQHWSRQVAADEAKLAQAEQALHDAEVAVSEAQAAASAGVGGPAQHAAASALASAHSRLAQAQAAVHDAKHGLQRAEDELHRWEARGRQVWQQAQEAGSRASAAIGSLNVPPPPPSPAVPAPGPGSPGTGSPGAVPAAAGAITVAAGVAGAGTSAGTGMPAGAGTTAGGPSLPAVSGGASQGAITFADLQEVGRRFGWSQNELQAWWQVISDESGGNPGAVNASSGAFGIGQFLGGTYREYLPFGAGSSNPMNQLNAMAQYIHDRYGSPLAALAHENSSHWY